nr:hypothetical protein [Tanacetum cinerariifolium]
TLAKHIIVVGAENHPPMLEKSIQTRLKKYSELTEEQQLQDDCDVQATNIILHGLPPDVYALVNHHELINNMHTIGMTMQQVQVNTKFLNARPLEWSKFVTDVKLARACILPPMIRSLRFPPLNNQLRTSSNPRNQAPIQDGRVTEKAMLAEAQEAGQILDEEQLAFLSDPGMDEAPVAQQTIPQNAAFQTKYLDAYDSDCDDLSLTKAVLMAISSYDQMSSLKLVTDILKKDKIKAKTDKTRHGLEKREKSKSAKSTSTKVKVKNRAKTEEMLHGPT